MKIKDYVCKDCGYTQELFVIDGATPQCEDCQSTNLDPIPSGFGGLKISGSNSGTTVNKGSFKRGKK